MKKILLIFVLATFSMLFFVNSTSGQEIEDSLSSPTDSAQVSKLIKNIFINLDTNKIATGFLIDKALFSDIGYYDGIKDTIISQKAWNNSYWDLYNAKILKSKVKNLIDIDSLVKMYTNYIDKNNVIPIGIINIDYNEIKENALNDNLLIVQNNMLYDNGYKPYYTKRAFIASPLLYLPINSNSAIRFIIDSTFYFSNVTDSIYSIDIDFGDGKGYQKIKFGDIVTVTYNSGTTTIIIKVKFCYSNSKGDIALPTRISTSAREIPIFPSEDELYCPLQQWDDLWAETAYTGTDGTWNAGGKVSVMYGCNNNCQLRKPFIFVEGIDFSDEKKDMTLKDVAVVQYGSFGIYNFVNGADDLLDKNGIGTNLIDQLKIEKLPEMINRLTADGYDVMLLDFKNGHDYIQRNAFLVVTLIKTVNQILKNNNSNSKITLCGASMGGLVTRYALTYMEKNNIEHNVSTWITFDSPHNGANIPLGDQYLLRFVKKNLPKISATVDAYNAIDILNTIATKQMLLYHYLYFPYSSPEKDILFNDIYFTIPQKPFKFAISCGSGLGINQGWIPEYYTPGVQMVNKNDTWAVFGVHLKTWAVPNDSKTKIFSGYINFLLYQVYENIKVKGTLPFDNTSGGKRATNYDINKYMDNTAYHCFIPTASSVGIKLSTIPLCNSVKQVFFNNYPFSDNNSFCPFNRVYFPDNNLEHVQMDRELLDNLYAEVSPDVLLIQNKTIADNNLFEARDNIIAGKDVDPSKTAGAVIIKKGADVTMRAGKSVNLKDGFHAEAGSNFRACVEPSFFCPLPPSPHPGIYNEKENNNPSAKIENAIYKIVKESENLILVYPNPNDGKFSLKLSNTNNNITIKVFDVLGKIVYEKEKITGNYFNINISDKQKGIYFIKIIANDKIYTDKIIVQ